MQHAGATSALAERESLVKFVAFHLMPFDGLPEDFSSTHRSVWVDIDPRLCDPVRINQLYNDYLDTLECADAAGFDALGINEHHSCAYGLMPSPNIMGGGLARCTSRAKLLVMGNAIPLYSPAIRVAEELAMLDVLSGGRVIAGLPLGTSQDANFAYGIPPSTIRERYREGLDLVTRAWKADEVFSFNGKYNKLRYVNPWPRPLQKPHPPLWIPGSGSLETFELATQLDAPYVFLTFFGTSYAAKNLQVYWDEVERAGLSHNPYRAGMAQFVFVADTDAEAERIYSPYLRYFVERSQHLYPGFASAPGYKSVASLQAAVPASGSVNPSLAATSLRNLTWGQMVERGIIIAGSPATVAERLEAASVLGHIGNWVLMMHCGNMPKEVAMQNVQLFGDQVAPRLRGLWSQYEHEWWPKEQRRDVLPTGGSAVALV
jgi:alkanesulfonate monooxygenase SsuD/methylene tetrahydromethanopterin reductase-like flavin-dependent oxidoreductase (luciferase family)